MSFIKNTVDKIIMTMVNKFSQSYIREVNDGITSSEKMKELCRQAAAEGCVLLKNDGVLPLGEKRISVFGRCQINTFYVGYGSGGDIRAPYKISILKGLKDGGANLNVNVVSAYEKWTKKHIPTDGFWGFWPMYYEEMPVKEDFVKRAAEDSETAVAIIGRAAGEDRENVEEAGSWYLTRKEKKLLTALRKYFKKVCVVINSGSIIDVTEIEKIGCDALLFAWQGGQETGNAVADILLGKISPSGKLTDTVARIQDYPSYKNFGKRKYNNYEEDIYVGYRYFNTFKRDSILYPFGYGLGYTKFDISDILAESDGKFAVKIKSRLKNIGAAQGKEVLQIYISKPQGKVGNPATELAAYFKTSQLPVGGEELCELTVDFADFACYDDTGATGYKNSFVLEKGEYLVFAGFNSIELKKVYSFELTENVLIKRCEEACAPRNAFIRLVNRGGLSYDDVPIGVSNKREKILNSLPAKITKTDNEFISFKDVKTEKQLNEFVAGLSVDELETITRGSLYGSNSPLGVNGNAGTFGADDKFLSNKGVPIICTNDGPSGVRLQAHSTLIPNGVSLASTFNDNLIENLACELGKEVVERNSNVILAPGINIHRHPLAGRNFEYYSEDPYMTGKIAAAYVKGVQSAGAFATVKHFACNNQERHRHTNDSRVSQRALREIYLKGFEICINEAAPAVLMMSYNKLNGEWNCYNFELATQILRQDWNYRGCVVTDWWMNKSKCKYFKNIKNQAYRIRAQVDVFMPGSDRSGIYKGKSDNSIKKSLDAEDGLTVAELQRCAKNVLRCCQKITEKTADGHL